MRDNIYCKNCEGLLKRIVYTTGLYFHQCIFANGFAYFTKKQNVIRGFFL